MNTIRIIERDADHVGPKVFLGIRREPGDGYYTLRFGREDELMAQVSGFFNSSIWLSEVKRSIREAVRLNGGEVALPGKSDVWIEFIRQNRERLGKHSRPLAA